MNKLHILIRYFFLKLNLLFFLCSSISAFETSSLVSLEASKEQKNSLVRVINSLVFNKKNKDLLPNLVKVQNIFDERMSILSKAYSNDQLAIFDAKSLPIGIRLIQFILQNQQHNLASQQTAALLSLKDFFEQSLNMTIQYLPKSSKSNLINQSTNQTGFIKPTAKKVVRGALDLYDLYGSAHNTLLENDQHGIYHAQTAQSYVDQVNLGMGLAADYPATSATILTTGISAGLLAVATIIKTGSFRNLPVFLQKRYIELMKRINFLNQEYKTKFSQSSNTSIEQTFSNLNRICLFLVKDNQKIHESIRIFVLDTAEQLINIQATILQNIIDSSDISSKIDYSGLKLHPVLIESILTTCIPHLETKILMPIASLIRAHDLFNNISSFSNKKPILFLQQITSILNAIITNSQKPIGRITVNKPDLMEYSIKNLWIPKINLKNVAVHLNIDPSFSKTKDDLLLLIKTKILASKV